MRDQRLHDDGAHAHPGIERRERVLEDRLDPAAVAVASRRVERRQVRALEPQRAGRRRLEPEHELGGRGLAAARLPDDAERLARLDHERDAVHRAHGAGRAAEEPASHREMLDEIDGLEQRGHDDATQQRTVWPVAVPVSGGASARQRSMASGQRGWKAQPSGSAERSGGWPPMAVSRCRVSAKRGIDWRSARV